MKFVFLPGRMDQKKLLSTSFARDFPQKYGSAVSRRLHLSQTERENSSQVR